MGWDGMGWDDVRRGGAGRAKGRNGKHNGLSTVLEYSSPWITGI